MRNAVNIFLLVILFIPGPAVTLIDLSGAKRHVIIQVHHDHGAVVLNGKKVRVPYSMQETAIPTQVDGLIEYLFLDNYQVCLVTVLLQLAMGVLLILIYCVNTIESRWYIYRPRMLRSLFLTLVAFIITEVISSYVYKDWVIDVKNGVNGHLDLFGANATFPNIDYGSLNLDYQPAIQIFVIPLIALAVLLVNRRRPEQMETEK